MPRLIQLGPILLSTVATVRRRLSCQHCVKNDVLILVHGVGFERKLPRLSLCKGDDK